MKVTILNNSQIKYSGHYLVQFQTYSDLDDKSAQELIKLGEAKLADDSIQGVSYMSAPEAQVTPKFDVRANGGFVAEAPIDPAKKAKLEAEGKLTDPTPVVGDNLAPKDTQPEPEIKTAVVDGDRVLTDEEIRQKEQAAAAGASAHSDAIPTVQQAQNSGQVVTP